MMYDIHPCFFLGLNTCGKRNINIERDGRTVEYSRQKEREGAEDFMFIIWWAVAIFLFFIALESGVSFWLNSEKEEEMSKSKEMFHIIRNKLLRKSVS